MSEREIFDLLVLSWFGLSAVTFGALLFIIAPYGRHARKGWGPTVDNKVGWVLMEAPASLLMLAFFVTGQHNTGAVAWAFLIVWQTHYVHRAFIYPLSLRTTGKRMPLAVAVLGFVFNGVNAYINGRWVFHLSGGYPDAWLMDPRFIGGLALFAVGYGINKHSDFVLKHLRKPGETGYKIPRGGAYRFVSCPNYLGEILEWGGWALMTWCVPGVAFLVWTAANLAPRARQHHAWYREKFADYPPERKALLPGIW